MSRGINSNFPMILVQSSLVQSKCCNYNSLQQLDHAISWNGTCVANFSKDETKFLPSYLLTGTNIVEDILQPRKVDLILRILGSSDNLLLETRRRLLCVAKVTAR